MAQRRDWPPILFRQIVIGSRNNHSFAEPTTQDRWQHSMMTGEPAKHHIAPANASYDSYQTIIIPPEIDGKDFVRFL